MSRKLHIGGKQIAPGWEIFNAIPSPDVDHVGDARDLSRFDDSTFSEIYASHILEHIDFKNELDATLIEWRRVLQPGGTIYISVPDMDTLCQLFLAKDRLNINERFLVMTMIFGSHRDQYDYHVVGLNMEFLMQYLLHAGFQNIRRVKFFDLDLFHDTSRLLYFGVPISLNIIAEKRA